MKDAFGMILTGENDQELRELTLSRSVAAMPFGCRYRIIDSILSNMVHSGIGNIGIVVQKNYHSLMDHLESGREWDLSRNRDGLHILPPYVSRDNTGGYGGVLDALRANMGYIRRSSQRYVVLCGSDVVFNMRYDDMMAAHLKTGADITMLYNMARRERQSNPRQERIYLDLDQQGRVRDIEVDPVMPRYQSQGMGAFIMEKSLLQYLVDTAQAHGRNNFNRDILQKMFGELRIFGYQCEGYAARIHSVEDYYRFNMDLLDREVFSQILEGPYPVLTKVKNEVPARYEKGARIANTLVADGCIIEGEVENSILFRGVRIGKGCVVKDCIIMQDSELQDGACLTSCILDKDVFIKRDRHLAGQPNYPVLVAKGTII